MPREISDEQYNYYENRRMVADFVESIYNDPALSKEHKRLIKKKYPNLAIPDLDIEDRVEARFAEEKKSREDRAEQARRQKQDADWKAARKKTKDEYGFTDEAMERLEKLMVERSIGDYDVAAQYMASKEPRATEAQNESRFWRHDQEKDFAEIAKDPEKWGEQEILRALKADEARAKQWR